MAKMNDMQNINNDIQSSQVEELKWNNTSEHGTGTQAI